MDQPHVQAVATAVLCGLAACAMLLGGCGNGFQKIDRRVDAMLKQTSADLGGDAYPPASMPNYPTPAKESIAQQRTNRASEKPPTVNPAAADLQIKAIDQAEGVIQRLEAYNQISPDARPLDLAASLVQAATNSREYQFATEEYVLGSLRLLIEQHRWGPQFFDQVSANVIGNGTDGFYDTSLLLINEFRVTQKLPYGGEISARALANATEELHSRVSDGDFQNAAMILSADIPLLRGAGLIAQEGKIQASRDLVYAARDFEQFRRDFFFEIATDFLNLVLVQQSVYNAERQVDRLALAQKREETLYEAGRSPYFQAALAQQSTVSAQDQLNNRREAYRLTVDRFKVRIGLPTEAPVVITPSGFDLPLPDISMQEAVRDAFMYRLDLQTQSDQVEDAQRGVDIALNALLPDLNLAGSVTLPTDPDRRKAVINFSPGDTILQGGVTFGLPLNREIERLNVRRAQINLERGIRDLSRVSDDIAVQVRSDVRDIDRARYALQIQERSVEIGIQRQASIDAAPDRATARDVNDAANALSQARDRRDSARRDLQVSVLRLLLDTGQLRINPNGTLKPLRGMEDARMVTTPPPPITPTVPEPPPSPPEDVGASQTQPQSVPDTLHPQ